MIKKCTYSLIILLVGMLLFVSTISAVPEIEGITFEPQNPEPLSTVTFTATILGDGITSVRIIIQECKEDICFIQNNFSMSQQGTEYRAEVQLERDETTYVKYYLVIEDSEGWTNFKDDIKQFDLTLPSNGNQNGGNGDSSPGFEIILALISIFLIVMLFKRKRL